MIIGIESSCDESAVALFDASIGIRFEEIASQIELHNEYGGVVPELASREHVKNFVPLVQNLKNFGIKDANLIAVANEPGLPGCVHMGIAVAKAMALSLQLPITYVNHLHGHLFSPFISVHRENPSQFPKMLKNSLPHLGLLASGGNTILFIISDELKILKIAETVDDAAGEAFDKGAKLLGLPYPGGIKIEQLAKSGDSEKFRFPRAFSNSHDMKFSFSGLKTSLKYFIEKFEHPLRKNLNDICASYQKAIIDALVVKTTQALSSNTDIKSIGISGGVANNDLLREEMGKLAKKSDRQILLPQRNHCGDNAAMIAFAGYIDKLREKLS